MSVYIDRQGVLHQDHGASPTLHCPGCQGPTQVTPIAVPAFAELQQHRPRAVGVIYRCGGCNTHVFVRYPVREINDQRVELNPQFEELERLEERFSLTHVPDQVALLFREALGCLTHGHFNAVASMCRRTVRTAQLAMTDAQRQTMNDELHQGLRLAEVEGGLANDVWRILFGSDADPYPNIPEIDDTVAGALIELVKDLLYQTYLRPRRLQQSLQMRMFFSAERSGTFKTL